MSDYYGFVEGYERPADIQHALKTDPFESLLGLCRTMGIYYEVRKSEHIPGYWVCSGRITASPADFFGNGATQPRLPGGGPQTFTVIGAESPLSGMRTVVSMMFSDMMHNCAMWRRMVSETQEFKHWFTQAPPKTAETPTN